MTVHKAQGGVHKAQAVPKGLTAKQAAVASAIQDALKKFTTPKAQAAFSNNEMVLPNRDFAQAPGVALHAPPQHDGSPDNRTYTRIGINVEPRSHGFKGVDNFLVSLYDAKGEPQSGKGPYGGDGPFRLIRLDSAGLKALIQANDADSLGSAFKSLFDNVVVDPPKDMEPFQKWVSPPVAFKKH